MTSRRLSAELTERLYVAFMEARKRKLSTINEYDFEMNYPANLAILKQDIISRKYRPSRGIAFVTDKPVIREIFAAPFRDRIVHHLIIDYIGDWWDRRFIYDSYSCRKGKGTDFGIRRFYYHGRVASDNFRRLVYVIKFDIKGYFTSLPRKRIYDRLLWGLQQQFLGNNHTAYDVEIYNLLKFLCRQIIFDDPIRDVIVKGNPELWAKLPPSKSLFHQAPGVGIVIGNLTSQVVSNIYLDQLDRFIINTLGYKHYGRYVDDFYIILREEELGHFNKCHRSQIEDFITGLGLSLQTKKCTCQPFNYGTSFLGARIYPHRILPGNRIIKNYRRDIKLVAAGELGLDALISYYGRMSHFDSQHLEKALWDSVGWDYLPTPKKANSRWYTDPKDLC